MNASSIGREEQHILGTPGTHRRSFPQNTAPAEPAGGIPAQAGAIPNAPDQDRTLGIPRRELKTVPLQAGERDPFDIPVEDDIPDESSPDTAGLGQFWLTADPIVVSILVMGSGVILLYLVVQVLTAISLMATWPAMAMWLGYCGISILTALVGIAMTSLGLQYVRLRRSPQISMSTLAELHDRNNMRRAALRHGSDAQRKLEMFLREYPLDHKCPLLKFGSWTQKIDELTSARERLSGPRGSDLMWINELDRCFLSILDEIARSCIQRGALQVGLRTAVAPGYVDAPIVLINAYQLIGDLCRIYNLRAGRWATFRLLLHVFVNAVAANRLDEAADELTNGLANAISESTGQVLASATRLLGTRVAEGTANGLLLSRLGYATMRALRPIRLEKRAA